MRKSINSFALKAMLAATSFAIAGGALCTYVVRADDIKTAAESKMDDMKMGDNKTSMSPEDSKALVDRIDKMKEMAADPAQAETMKTEMAKMMVMDRMAKMMAQDPKTQEAVASMMSDENVKKVREEAMKMANDPDQMKKIQDDIMADPAAMKHLDHQAIMMSMHQAKKAKGDAADNESMMDKMKDKMK